MAITTWDTSTHVQGSPFSLEVLDDTTDGSSALAATGDWRVENFSAAAQAMVLEAGEPLQFQVQLKDTRRLEQQAIRLRAVVLAQQNAVQRVQVTASPFTLSFRGSPTVSVTSGTSFATLKTTLESLTTVSSGGITVAPETAGDTTVTLSHAFLVTFTKETGSLPLMIPSAGATVTLVTNGVTPVRQEVQTLKCTSSVPLDPSVLFTVSFGTQQVTVASSDTLVNLATKLTALVGGSTVSVISEVAVQLTVCAQTSAARLLIQFDALLGNVAALTYSTPSGSLLVLVSEADNGNSVSGVYPAWGSFQLAFPDSDETTVAIPFDASSSVVETALEALSLVDQVAVTRDWFDITTESAGAELVTLAQWTITFMGHSGNVPELIPDSSGVYMHDDGQRRPFVETMELVRGSVGNNRSVSTTTDIAVALATTLEQPGVQETQTLLCIGDQAFTLSYSGQNAVIQPDMSLSELETQLNVLGADARVYAVQDEDGVRRPAAALSTALVFVPVCSVASPHAIDIVFNTPVDVPLLAWSSTSNDVYLTEAVKGVAPSEVDIAIANTEIQTLVCQVTVAEATLASFDLSFAGQRITIGATMLKGALQTQLNSLQTVIDAGGVDVSSTQAAVCSTSSPSRVVLSFRSVGDQPLFVISQRRNGILQADVTETTKGLDALVFDGSRMGLFNVTTTPIVRGTYALSVEVLNQLAFFPPTLQVLPTLASGATSTHTAPAVVTQGVTQRFTIQAIDRFNNSLESSTELGPAAFVPQLTGPNVGGWSETEGEAYPVAIDEAQPNTNGVFSLSFLPQRAGLYSLSVFRRQAGGLWATYFRTVDFSDSYASRQDAAISFQWGETSPLGDPFPNKYYSVQWEGELRAVVSGPHVFTLRADDAVMLTVDGQVLLDLFSSSVMSSSTVKAEAKPIELRQGQFYKLEIRYRTRDAQSFINLEWACEIGGLTRTKVPSEALFTSTALANTPFSIQGYPGVLDVTQVLNSFDNFVEYRSSNTPIEVKALEPLTFELEARDAFGNSRLQSGSDQFEVSMVGVGGWALSGRINDVTSDSPIQLDPTYVCTACAVNFVADTGVLTHTGTLTLNVDVASRLEAGVRFQVLDANSGTLARRRDCQFVSQGVPGPFTGSAATVVVESVNGCDDFSNSQFDISAVTPTDWSYLGTCSVVSESTSLTACSSDFPLERGDLITVGREAHRVHYTSGLFDAADVPLSSMYRGETSDFVPVFKVGATTGRHTVAIMPYVKGLYELSVRVPAVDAVMAVITHADSTLGGSFTLLVAGTATGTLSYNALAPVVQSALENLPAVGVGNVAVTALCVNSDASQGCRWAITFSHVTEQVALSLTASYDGVLSGNNARVTVQTLTAPRSAQMVQGFPKQVQVTPGPINPSVSTAFGRGLYASTAGELASFFVQMKDTHGNNQESDDGALQIQIFPSGSTFTSSQTANVSQVAYVSEGLYEIVYTPVLSGRHTVAVTAQTAPEVHAVSSAFAQSGTASEPQRGGTFALRLLGQTTGALAFDANASEVQQALLNLPVFETLESNASHLTMIDVTRATNNAFGFDYSITYTRLPAQMELELVEVVNSLYSSGTSGATMIATLQTPQQREHIKTSTSLGTPIVNEEQIVRVETTGTALTGGFFQLTFNGQTTDLIPFNAQASALESALNRLPSIGQGGVSVGLTRDTLYYEWIVTFVGATAGQAQTADWSSARYTPGRLVQHAALIGNLPPLQAVTPNSLVGGLAPAALIYDSGAASVNYVSVNGVSPFATVVAHGALVPEKCTAVDDSTPFWPGSTNVVGLAGLHSGTFHSRSRFLIETRDVNGNLLDGTGGGLTGAPQEEVQIIETGSSAGPTSRLTGTFVLVLAGQKTAPIPANAGIHDVEAALEALNVLSGAVTVTTPDVQTEVLTGTVGTTKSSNILTTSADLSASDFTASDWIRVGSTSGPVFVITALTASSITLSSVYQEASGTGVNVFKQNYPGAGFTYQVHFDSELDDLPALTVDVSTVSGGLGTAKITACDYLRTQQVQSTAASQLGGTFSLSFRGSSTPMMPWNVNAATLSDALEALDGIHSVSVSAGAAGTNGAFTWLVTLVSTESQGDQDLELLYAEGYLLLGQQARIDVTSVCPATTTVEGITVRSQSGQEGHSFMPILRGASTVVADVRYLTKATYEAIYDTPREATYSLDVRYVEPRGLLGSYFDNRWLYGAPALERVDMQIDFAWQGDYITPTSREHVSVRWQGYLKPAFSEEYVFSVRVNDGARLWVENQLVIDQYDYDVEASGASGAVEFRANASVALAKDRLTEMTLEYRENAGIASISLQWESRTQPKSVVPSSRLFHRSDAIFASPFAVQTHGSKPSRPTNASLNIAAANALTLSFYAPEDDGGAPVDGYQVEWWTYGAYGPLEIQVVKIALTNTGGTFTLKLTNGQTTGPLAAAVLYSEMEAALEALEDAGDITVTSSLSSTSRDYMITFTSRVTAVPPLQVDTSLLIGTQSAVVCAKGAVVPLARGLQCAASESETGLVTLLGSSNQVSLDLAKRGDPYTFQISGLSQLASTDTPSSPGEVGGAAAPGYEVRVTAHNSADYGLPSATVALKPMAVPAAPENVELRLVAGSFSSLRLWWDAPATDNAAIITYYVVEWRRLDGQFTDGNSFRESPGFFRTAHPPNSRFKYTVTGLTPGTAYVVQVRAKNIMGVGSIGLSVPTFEIPRSKAAPLSEGTGGGVALSVRPASSSTSTAASCSTLQLSWLAVAPADAHGADVTSYVVDWFQPQSPDTAPFEVQVLQIYGQDSTDAVSGTFRVLYSDSQTEPLPVDVSEAELQDSLEALPTLRDVQVERSVVAARSGYEWTVTFLSEAPAVLGKTLTIDSTDLSATMALDVDVGAWLDTAHVGSAAVTIAAVEGDTQVTSTDASAATAQTDMYLAVSQLGGVSGVWRVVDVSILTGTTTIALATAFPGVSGNYAARLGWTVPGALPTDYHSLVVLVNSAGTSVNATQQPYTLTLESLPSGVAYSARVSACNSLGCNAPTMATPLALAAPKQKPAAPRDVALFADGGSTLRVRWRHPASDGGDAITHYRLEWDPKPTFDSGDGSSGSSMGYERKPVGNLGVDCLLTPCEAVIGSLLRGTAYYVRVYGYNSFGYSLGAGLPIAPGFGVPKTLSAPPSRMLLEPTTASKGRSLVVRFNTSSSSFDNGGADVTQYQIEWDAMDLEAVLPSVVAYATSGLSASEISGALIGDVLFADATTQLLLLSADAYDVRGSFRLAFLDAVTVEPLPWDVTAEALTDALEALPTVGRVQVRRVYAGHGFAWFVRFLTAPLRAETLVGSNGVVGDLPLLQVSLDNSQLLAAFSSSQTASVTTSLTGTGAQLASATLIRAFNGFEQQVVGVTTTAGDLGGSFQLVYDQQQSVQLPVNASAFAVQRALSQLEGAATSVGDIQVYKRESATPVGFYYTVVYLSRLGPNRPLVDCLGSELTSSSASASLSCETTRVRGGGLPSMHSDLYGVVVVDKPELVVDGDDMAKFEVPGLLPGVSYHVRVSAWNGVGNSFGETRASTPARVAVQSVPDAPRDITVEPLSSSELLVSWTQPLNTGGSSIIRYVVQVAERRGISEQQLLKADSSLGDLTRRRLVLSLRLGDQEATAVVVGDVSSDELRFALVTALNLPDAVASVSRRSVGLFDGYGYEWVVTFSASLGNVPLLEVTEVNTDDASISPEVATALTLSVKEQVQGSVDGGSMISSSVSTVTVMAQHEVQRVSIYSAGPVDLGGSVLLSVGGESTSPIPVDATVQDVRVALEGLSTVGEVLVDVQSDVTERTTLPARRYGVQWNVTFVSTFADLPLIQVSTDPTLPFRSSACGGTLSGLSPCVEALELLQGGLPLQATLSGLSNATNYVVRVSAANTQFSSEYATVLGAFQPTAQPPTEVQAAQASPLAVDTIAVTWSPPLSNGGAQIVHYKVQWDVSANFDQWSAFSGSEVVTASGSATNFEYTITGLNAAHSYFVSVVAYNSRGYGVPTVAEPVDAHERVVQLVIESNTLDESVLSADTLTLAFLNFPTEVTTAIPVLASASEMQSALQRLPVVGVVSVSRSDYSQGPAATPYDDSGVATAKDFLLVWMITFRTASIDGVSPNALGALTSPYSGPCDVLISDIVAQVAEDSKAIQPRAMPAVSPQDVQVSAVDVESLG
ncbi:hypothetical protein BBJ28_00000989, partial [Nothophytophthora sp. Chile5]